MARALVLFSQLGSFICFPSLTLTIFYLVSGSAKQLGKLRPLPEIRLLGEGFLDDVAELG